MNTKHAFASVVTAAVIALSGCAESVPTIAPSHTFAAPSTTPLSTAPPGADLARAEAAGRGGRGYLWAKPDGAVPCHKYLRTPDGAVYEPDPYTSGIRDTSLAWGCDTGKVLPSDASPAAPYVPRSIPRDAADAERARAAGYAYQWTDVNGQCEVLRLELPSGEVYSFTADLIRAQRNFPAGGVEVDARSEPTCVPAPAHR